MTTVTIHKTTQCPDCKAPVDCASAISEGTTPRAGDYSICFKCAAVLQFTDGLGLKAVDAEDVPPEARDPINEVRCQVLNIRTGDANGNIIKLKRISQEQLQDITSGLLKEGASLRELVGFVVDGVENDDGIPGVMCLVMPRKDVMTELPIEGQPYEEMVRKALAWNDESPLLRVIFIGSNYGASDQLMIRAVMSPGGDA